MRRSPTTTCSPRCGSRTSAGSSPTDDVYLLPFPLSHIAGYNVIHHHARLRPGGADAPVRCARVRRDGRRARGHRDVARGDDAPQPARPARRASRTCRPSSASLRLIAYGAAPMPVPLLQRGHERARCRLHPGYGMTELAGNAVFLDVAAHRRGLAGRSRAPGHRRASRVPGVDVRLAERRRDPDAGATR